MLRPVDLDTVFAQDRVHGADHGPVDTGNPDQVHTGLAWWIGGCLVMVARARAVALVHDGSSTAANYARAFGQGAINGHPYTPVVSVFTPGGMNDLVHLTCTLDAPGALITTLGRQVTIQLIRSDSTVMTMDDDLGHIRDLIAVDRAPRPVDTLFKGRIELLAGSPREEHV